MGKIDLDLNLPVEPFNVNAGVVDNEPGTCRLPSSSIPRFSIDDYASSWTNAAKSAGGLIALAKDLQGSLPPYTQSFSRMSYMPTNTTTGMGVLQWPGLPPETLTKLGREQIAINMVIQLRAGDIMRFAERSTAPWRPGWEIKPRNLDRPDSSMRKDINDAVQFIANCGYGDLYADPIERDKLLRPSFSKFMLKTLRDSLLYDGIAIWKEVDDRGMIKSFAPLPAANIRLLARPDRAKLRNVHQQELDFFGGKEPSRISAHGNEMDSNNPPFAVAVDETNNIVQSFTRDELVWYVRNPRANAEISEYGFSEAEMALILITGFNNAVQFNADIFDKNSIPKGILAIKGNFTQRQFDALGRIWDNLQRGNRTDWTLPALQLSEKGEIELINLEPLRKEPIYYANLMNLFAGVLCVVYQISPHQLGLKVSGTSRDSRPESERDPTKSEEDPGLPALLTHYEIILNEYFIWNRWPHLAFMFTGKSPKEDARLYEISLMTKTVDERRALVGDPSYADTLPKDATDLDRWMAKTMGMAPVDTALVPVYQAAIAALVKAGAVNAELGIPIVPAGGEGGAGGGTGGKMDAPGVRFPPKKDPAKSEAHGHTSGVRRDSKQERANAPAKKTLPPNLRRRDESYSTPDTTGYSKK